MYGCAHRPLITLLKQAIDGVLVQTHKTQERENRTEDGEQDKGKTKSGHIQRIDVVISYLFGWQYDGEHMQHKVSRAGRTGGDLENK